MQTSLTSGEKVPAKPFLKWIGGKKQLLKEIERRLPEDIKKTKRIDNYFEPFLGGGAVFFHLKYKYEIEESFLSDLNPELILTYNVIKKDPDKLIDGLELFESDFLELSDEKRKKYYNDRRAEFNNDLKTFNFEKYSKDTIKRAIYMIFLNKTCFNGMFRVNNRGEFNVPIGRYKKPKICDKENLYNVHEVLNDHVTITQRNYLETEVIIPENSFVYLDPPYRPLNKTSSFTSYTSSEFKEEDQIRLSEYFKTLTENKVKVMLSNSDPTNYGNKDDFFERYYDPKMIKTVKAIRSINSNGKKRNKINELMIINY